MKQAKNNYIDLLLRKLAHHDGGVSVPSLEVDDGSIAAEAQHLDADELNSYAENVLPVAARARYTAHLADCDSCRKRVTQLSLATESSVRPKETKTPAGSILFKYLSKFFAPGALRYAASALVVLLVVAIGFIVQRQKQQNRAFEVQNQTQSTPPLSDQRYDQKTEAPGEVAEAPASQNGANPSKRKSDSSKSADGPEQQRQQDQPVAKTPVDETSQVAKVQQPMDQQNSVTVAEPANSVDRLKGVETEAKKESAKQKQAAATEVVAGKREEDKDRKPETASAQTGPSKVENLPLNGRSARIGNLRAGVASDAAGSRPSERRSDEVSEVRSVGGHRFRKQGNVWVDAAYDSSRTTINIVRGSEQYRALIGDEPDIRTIADQLDGEVIIVWKGRAYRIR